MNNKDARNEHFKIFESFPPYKDLVDEPRYANKKYLKALLTMANGRAAPTYYIPPAHEILEIVGQATLDVMYGKSDAKTALDKAAKEADAVMAKYK